VLVLNPLPFAPPSAVFSDGLIYRFRLRPLTVNAREAPVPFAVDGEEAVIDCVFSAPVDRRGANGPEQEGTCWLAAGEAVPARVNDERGGRARGVRVFAGPRWDPFILDAPAALNTIATGRLAFTDPGAIYLDGKNVLSVVVEVDCARLLGGAALFAVVAETLTRGSLNVRLERAGRAEAVRPGEPRPGDPRPLQHGGRISPQQHLRGRVPGPAEREPRVLGWPGR
jgi:hypothetical protein